MHLQGWNPKENPLPPCQLVHKTGLPLLRTLLAIRQKSWEPSFREVIDSCYISICKFGSFRNPFATITSLSELYLRFRRFILLVQRRKKMISTNYGSSTSSWKPRRWVIIDLILTMRDIYISYNLNPFTKLTSSNRSIEFKDISHGTSLKWSRRLSQSARE